MFGKKYIFETTRTKYKRYLKNALLFLSSFSLIYVFFGPYIVYYSNKLTEQSNLQFFQKSPDLIVVFTGDTGRIPKAVELAQKHKSSKIFISGVYAKNTVDRLVALTGKENQEVDTIRFNIDYLARNTLENVISMINFLKKEKELKKILIISSDYHIYRIQRIAETLKREDADYEFYYSGTKTDFVSFRAIKILYKEVYKIFQAQAFLLVWDSEVID